MEVHALVSSHVHEVVVVTNGDLLSFPNGSQGVDSKTIFLLLPNSIGTTRVVESRDPQSDASCRPGFLVP